MVSPPTRRPGRPGRIDRDDVVAAVLAVGFERLTVSAVAEHLGTVHSALYHHVRDRADLVTAAVDALARTLPAPPPGQDWVGHLRHRAQSVWDLLEAHPGLSAELTVQAAPLPSVDAIWASDLQVLLDAGFGPDDAVLALDTVLDLPFDVSVRVQHLRRLGQVDGAGQPRSADWFTGKLEIVLAGIGALLAPAPHPPGPGRHLD